MLLAVGRVLLACDARATSAAYVLAAFAIDRLLNLEPADAAAKLKLERGDEEGEAK